MKPIIILNILTVITKVKDMQLIIMQAVKIILSDRLSINLNLFFVLETSVFSVCLIAFLSMYFSVMQEVYCAVKEQCLGVNFVW